MGKVVVSPMQWAEVKDIEKTPPVSETDHACLSEIRDVLRKHDMQNRFGVALLHSHFDLEDGEILLEEEYPDERKLVLQPTKREAAPESGIGTIFQLKDDELDLKTACIVMCRKGILGHHKFH